MGSRRFASKLNRDSRRFYDKQSKKENKATDDFSYYLQQAKLENADIERLLDQEEVRKGIYYLHGDHLGTATYVTNGRGETTQFFLNLPFGEIEGRDSPKPLKSLK